MPPEGAAKDTSQPTTVVGNGNAASCTSAAVVAAVANGGVVTFNCGADPVRIEMAETAKIVNNKPNLVLDGGGKVTLSGGNARRILYQNTCDERQVYNSARCDIDDIPRTTVQNIAMVDGNSAGQDYGLPQVYGGGAIYVRGGRMSVVNARFFRNQCESTGPDLGGAAIRAFGSSPNAPVYITNSTFGGAEGFGNQCSNGAAFSGLQSSFTVTNSLFTHNKAIGFGQNPAVAGTPGGGSGGAIYMDGNTFDLTMCGSKVENNTAVEGGAAIFYVSNNLTGTMAIVDSILRGNPKGTFETEGLPGIFVLAAPGQPVVTRSTISR